MGWLTADFGRTREQVEASLNNLVPLADEKMAAAKLEAGNMLADKIRSRAPSRSGHYRNSIRADLLVNNPSKRQAKGSRKNVSPTKDKTAVGIYAKWYWKFIEFGTVKMPARPHIFPTYRQFRKQIRASISKALRDARREAGFR